MSNVTKQCESDCDKLPSNNGVELIVKPKEKNLGEFSVRRVLPSVQRKKVGPWVFFDHMGPAHFAAGNGVNVRPHPHIGIATVTYLFDGEILHRDSLGSYQLIHPGDINLMVTGRGIVHSERERPEVKQVPHRAHGLQLWLALPKEQEEIEPAFYHYPAKDIPSLSVGGVPVRVMMGHIYGVSSPVKVFSETLYLEAHLQAGQFLKLPLAEERAVYVAAGNLKVKNTVIPEHTMAFFTHDPEIIVEATSESRIALIGGQAFEKRFIEWNFVSSRKERIEQAKTDWKEGRFAKVPGDEVEFIPLPD